jgi:hypothetical protein
MTNEIEIPSNDEDTKRKIEIMQAYLNGEPIQYFNWATGDWADYNFKTEPEWNFGKDYYRIKNKKE